MEQRYPENVIVTVRIIGARLEVDVRLPADGVFENWLPEFTAVLEQNHRISLDPHKISVSYNGKILRAGDTLASLGAWDGSVLWLEER